MKNHAYKFIFTFLFLFSFSTMANCESKFVVYTPPKCGTHLISKTMELLLFKESTAWLGDLPQNSILLTEQLDDNGKFVFCHNWPLNVLQALIKKDYKIIFILRDPRDHLTSVLHWSFCPNWGGPRHILNIKNQDQRLDELITGKRYGWPCYEFIKSRMNVLNKLKPTDYLIVKFENLVGEQGGGTHDQQILELVNIADFLGYDIPLNHIEQVAEHLWGNSPTFHIGKIGTWKNVLNTNQKNLYKRLYSKELINLGYEISDDW